jgi:hypothetical protein
VGEILMGAEWVRLGPGWSIGVDSSLIGHLARSLYMVYTAVCIFWHGDIVDYGCFATLVLVSGRWALGI